MNLRTKTTVAFTGIGAAGVVAELVLTGFSVQDTVNAAVIVIVSIFLAVMILEVIVTEPLQRITNVLDALSRGDFDVEIPEELLDREDEIGQLASAFERLLTSFELALVRTDSGDGTRMELWNQARQIQSALNKAPIGITVSDPAQEDNPLIYANEGFERLTGYSEEEVRGQNCRFLQGEETDPATVEKLRQAIAERRDVSVEIRNYRKDGEPFWNRVTIRPVFDDNDELLYFLGFQQDITQVKNDRADNQPGSTDQQ